MVSQKYVKKLNILGDSKLIVDWVCNKVNIVAPHLAHILQGIKQVYNELDWFSYGHICHELNNLEYKLSNEAFQLIPQVLKYQEYTNNNFVGVFAFHI